MADSDARLRAYLYDKNRSDREVDVEQCSLDGVGNKQLLWVDLSTSDRSQAGSTGEALKHLAGEKAAAWLEERDGVDPCVEEDDKTRLMVGLAAAATGARTVGLRCLVGPNWVVTAHDSSVDLIEAFNQAVSHDSNLGKLDGPRFFAVLLDRHLRSFFDRIEDLDQEIDELDEKLIAGPHDPRALDQIVDLRRRTGRLRRMVVDHRDVLARLADPELIVLSDSESATRFDELHKRLETVVSSIDSTRSSITGTLDVFMTRTAQRTNEVMKVLTLASVLLLPSTVIAGVMGMNFEVGLFKNPAGFWITIGSMFVVAATTLALARNRRWIGVKAA